ncbi:MAG: hypothetical protein PGN26_14330 [Xylophilus ampelinus]
MRALLRAAALLLAVTCAVWVAVLWHWQASRRAVDADDIVLYLAVLPLAAWGLALAVRWAVRAASQRQARGARPAAGPASGAAPVPVPATSSDPAGGEASWWLLGAWAHTAAGEGVDALRDAAAAGAPRPVPDAELLDDDGLPVLAARIAGLALPPRDALPASADGTPVPDRVRRALACLSAPLRGLAPALAERMQDVPGGDAPDRPWAAPAGAAPQPRVLAAWPSDWSDAACAAARDWLADELRRHLRACLPPAPQGVPAEAWPLPDEAIQAGRMSGSELLASAGRLLATLRAQDRADPVALLACHSDLDAHAVSAPDGGGLFHPAHRPRAPMAGEGAAALLLAAAAPAAAADGPAVRCAPPAFAPPVVADAAGAAGRASAADTLRLVERSLAGVVPEGVVARVVGDVGQHAAAAAELYAAALALLPALDAGADLLLAGTVTGRLGPAAALAALALAADAARAEGRPALAVSLGDAGGRMAAVLRPEPAGPPRADA